MPKGKVDIDKALASANASMAVEGLKPSIKTVTLSRQFLEGKLSSKEAVARVKAQHITNKYCE